MGLGYIWSSTPQGTSYKLRLFCTRTVHNMEILNHFSVQFPSDEWLIGYLSNHKIQSKTNQSGTITKHLVLILYVFIYFANDSVDPLKLDFNLMILWSRGEFCAMPTWFKWKILALSQWEYHHSSPMEKFSINSMGI